MSSRETSPTLSTAPSSASAEAAKRLVERLRSSEERQRILFEYAPDAYYLMDLEGRFVDGNRAAEALIGMRRQDLAGRSFRDSGLLDEGQLATATRSLARSALGEPNGPTEYRVTRPDGRRLVLDIRNYPVEIDGRQLVLNIARDVTEARRTEEELRRQSEWLRAIGEALPDLVLVLDEDCRAVDALTGKPELLAVPREEFLGRPVADVIPADVAELVADAVRETLRTGRPRSIRYELEVQAGRRAFEGRSAPMKTEIDGRRAVVFVIRDVTRRKQLEEQLRQSQKLELLGQLTSGIAHDFNNLLSVVSLNIDLLQSGETDARATRTALDEMAHATNGATALIQQLMSLTRPPRFEPGSTDLSAIVDGLTPLLRRLIPEDIQIEVSTVENAAVELDRAAVEQMILNLATNARDAMPGGGRLTLSVEHLEADLCRPQDGPWPEDRRLVCLKVSDTGCGMSEEIRDRIFEPFFTTKAKNRGNGLGLAMVRHLMQQHGGRIDVTSAPGEGSTFRLCFARSEGAVEPMADGPDAADIPEASGRGGERVLLVEDSAPLLGIARRVLERSGYSVVTAVDGREALEILESPAEPVDLVVSDDVMPTMGGRELFARLQRLESPPPFIMVSGYPEDVAESGTPPYPFVQKPWTAPKLLAEVRRALDTAPDAAVRPPSQPSPSPVPPV